MSSFTPVIAKVRFGAFEVDPTTYRLFRNGTPIRLQPQPLRVLLLLTECAGYVVTREEIRRLLWSDSTFVDFERGINFSINQIRSALGDNPQKARYIETIPRIGYRFIAPIITDRLSTPPLTRLTSALPESTQKHVGESGEACAATFEIEVSSSPPIIRQTPIVREKWPSVAIIAMMSFAAIVSVGYGVHKWLSRNDVLN